jgi:putative phosphoribosyl transferase
MFEDREEAGRMLAARLAKYSDKGALVLALPRGGVPVGDEIAKSIKANLMLIIPRKIGAPGNPELAIGAVSPDRSVIIDKTLVKQLGVTKEYIERETRIEGIEIERRKRIYGSDIGPDDVRGKIVIVVDDGMATGLTMRAAVRLLKKMKPKKIIVAVPVLPKDSIRCLRKELGDIVYLDAPSDFRAIGAHYRKFPQLTDDEVVKILKPYQKGFLK